MRIQIELEIGRKGSQTEFNVGPIFRNYDTSYLDLKITTWDPQLGFI